MGNFNIGNLIWIIVLFSIFSDALVTLSPLLLIVGVVLAITYGVTKSNGGVKSFNRSSYSSTTHTTRTTSRSTVSLNSTQIARINAYLKEWFSENKSLPIGTNVDLRLHDSTYNNLSSLDVYRDNTYICSLEDFRNRYPDSYSEIMNEVEGTASRNTQKKQAAEKAAEEAKKAKDAKYYIDEINRLNDDIPDEEISNGLYETTSLLGQIDKLEERFPNAKGKLTKLYEYYLPILVKILNQYDNLQNATTDPSFNATKEKLKKTIKLINDAMKTIITSMTDEDFINLSADIATLEAVLQKDGLTSDSNITMTAQSGKSDADVQ